MNGSRRRILSHQEQMELDLRILELDYIDLTKDEPPPKRQRIFTPVQDGQPQAKPSSVVSSQRSATPHSKSTDRSSTDRPEFAKVVDKPSSKNVFSLLKDGWQSELKHQQRPSNLDDGIKSQPDLRDISNGRQGSTSVNTATPETSIKYRSTPHASNSPAVGNIKNHFRMPVAQPIKFKADTPDSLPTPKALDTTSVSPNGEVTSNILPKFNMSVAQPIRFNASSIPMKRRQGLSSSPPVTTSRQAIQSLSGSQSQQPVRDIHINLPVRASPKPPHVPFTDNSSSSLPPTVSREIPKPSNIVINVPPTHRKRVRRELFDKLEADTEFVRTHSAEVERVLGLTGFSKPFAPIDPRTVRYEKAAQSRKRIVDRKNVKLDLVGSGREEVESKQLPVKEYKFVHPRDQAKAVLTDRFGEKFDPPLTFSNDVNDNRLNGKFQFIANYILRKGVKVNHLIGTGNCHCQGPSCQIDCICLHKKLDDFMGRGDEQVQSYEQRSDGLVVLTDTYIEKYATRAEISECNERCRCPPTCTNRVVQRGRTVPLEIFQTPRCGFGVRSGQKLVRGQFIELYLGEVITELELQRREDAKGDGASSYIYSLDWFSSHQNYHVDGENFGSAMRFVNHSCNPNARVFTVMNDRDTKQLHHVAFFAIRDISAGTEITIDYCPQEAGNVYEQEDLIVEDVTECRCGSANCRKRLWGPGKERRSRKRLLNRDSD